jgi:uncharacterized protein (TIGR02001 family)
MKRSKMTTTLKVAVAGMACAVAMAATAQEESAPLEASADVAFYSSYVWRGQVLTDKAVFQPSLSASKGGFGLNAWSSMNLDGTDTDGEFTEMDWTVSYGYSFGMVGLEVGFVEYTFPNSTAEDEEGNVVAYPGTREIYLSAGLDVLLAPTLLLVYDIDAIEGFYGSVSVGHSFELSEMIGLDLSASLGFADKDYNLGYFGYDDTALNDLVVGAALPISVTDSLSIVPSVSYMALPDSDLGDAAELAYGEKDMVYGGVTLSYAF